MDHRTFEQITLLPASESGEDGEDGGVNATNSLTTGNKPPPQESASDRKIRLKREELEN